MFSSRSSAVFTISVAADMVAMEIQNLRVYERRGLVAPGRTAGGTRRYSDDDITRLHRIRDLLAGGLNLAGVARVIALEEEVARLRAQNAELRRGESGDRLILTGSSQSPDCGRGRRARDPAAAEGRRAAGHPSAAGGAGRRARPPARRHRLDHPAAGAGSPATSPTRRCTTCCGR